MNIDVWKKLKSYCRKHHRTYRNIKNIIEMRAINLYRNGTYRSVEQGIEAQIDIIIEGKVSRKNH